MTKQNGSNQTEKVDADTRGGTGPTNERLLVCKEFVCSHLFVFFLQRGILLG